MQGSNIAVIQGTTAITAFGCDNLYLYGNDIDADLAGAFYNGIVLSNIMNNGNGASTLNNGNTNLFFFGQCENTVARHNIIGNASRGLRVFDGTRVGELNPMTFGFEHRHTGNTWTGAYSWVGAFNTGTQGLSLPAFGGARSKPAV